MLFQDLDIPSLFDVELDGIEDPDAEHQRGIMLGGGEGDQCIAGGTTEDLADPFVLVARVIGGAIRAAG